MSVKPAIPKYKFDSAIAGLESEDTVSIFCRDEDSFLHEIVVPKSALKNIPRVPKCQPAEPGTQ